MPLRLTLASASPARLALLRAAGIHPDVVVSDVDEDAVADALGSVPVPDLVVALAAAKARAVASGIRDGMVLGCDSMFEFESTVWGKPSGPDEAIERISSMRGNSGTLWTGHHLIEVASGREASLAVPTVVRFGPMTDDEVRAYVASGEPLRVAGSFTLDGRSAPFIDGVEGDHTNVVGLSLPGLRELLAGFGRSVIELWGEPG